MFEENKNLVIVYNVLHNDRLVTDEKIRWWIKLEMIKVFYVYPGDVAFLQR